MLNRVAGRCLAVGCTAEIPATMLMCYPHWRRVPRHVQKIIWASNSLSHPLYERSRRAARASVAAKEGHPLLAHDKEALEAFGLGLDGHPHRGAA